MGIFLQLYFAFQLMGGIFYMEVRNIAKRKAFVRANGPQQRGDRRAL